MLLANSINGAPDPSFANQVSWNHSNGEPHHTPLAMSFVPNPHRRSPARIGVPSKWSSTRHANGNNTPLPLLTVGLQLVCSPHGRVVLITAPRASSYNLCVGVLDGGESLDLVCKLSAVNGHTFFGNTLFGRYSLRLSLICSSCVSNWNLSPFIGDGIDLCCLLL